MAAPASRTRQGWETGGFMKISKLFAVITMTSLLCAGAGVAQQQAPSGLSEGVDPAIARRMAAAAASTELLAIPPAANEWLTWGYDQERTGWNRAETILTPKNVGQLKQICSTQLQVPVD